ncbi:MAG: hypothetical protein KDC24_09040 [Saprospiraceae bacterium]|nr:hypothetical protein [Saprospiraceae bacterium]
MKKQSSQRKHNFPDAELYLISMESLKLAKKDLPYFNEYGYGEDKLRKFFQMCESFRDFPDDDEFLGDQMLLTEKKYEAAENLKASIRSLMTRIATKFGNRSGRYRKFGANKLGDMTDAQLIFCGRRVVRVARGQLDFLADVGVNENVLQRIQEANQVFEKAVNLQLDRVAERDIGVERRIDKGNQLYEELVVLCTIGKDIWREKDRLRYDQYCLYESNNEQKKARKSREKAA